MTCKAPWQPYAFVSRARLLLHIPSQNKGMAAANTDRMHVPGVKEGRKLSWPLDGHFSTATQADVLTFLPHTRRTLYCEHLMMQAAHHHARDKAAMGWPLVDELAVNARLRSLHSP